MHKIASALFVVLVIIIGIASSGCIERQWTYPENRPYIEKMKMIPQGIDIYAYTDVATLRNDNAFEPIYSTFTDSLWFYWLSMRLDSEQVDEVIAGGDAMIMFGEFDLGPLRVALDEFSTGQYLSEDIQIWVSDQNAVALLENMVIGGSESGVQNIVKAVLEQETSLYDSSFKKVADRLPSGIVFSVEGPKMSLEDPPEGLELMGTSVAKKDADNMIWTSVSMFVDDDAAIQAMGRFDNHDNANTQIDTDGWFNIVAERNGEFVRITYEQRIEDYIQSGLAQSAQMVSSYQLTKRDYQPAEVPDIAQSFEWDFSNDVDHHYAYQQTMKTKISIGVRGLELTSLDDLIPEVKAAAKIVVRSQGDGTADLIMSDIGAIIDTGDPNVDQPQVFAPPFPPTTFSGIRQDGTLPVENPSDQVFIKLLFPLPSSLLNVGESEQVPMEMPFDAGGLHGKVQGILKLTLNGYVNIDGRTCAKLVGRIDMNEIVPDYLELDGYGCTVSGISEYYFDINAKEMVAGELAVVMATTSEIPVTESDFELPP